MKLYRARIALPMSSPAIEDGAVLVDGEKIVAVGRFEALKSATATQIDLGEKILLPGLVNAHCHLDYTMLRGAIPPQKSFTAWVRHINHLKADLRDADYLAAIRDGFAELIAYGTTSVANIESFPALLDKIPPPPIRAWWFLEVMDVRAELSPDFSTLAALAQRSKQIGISPHAPYTASPELYRNAKALGIPFTTHLAESREENALFHHAQGPLFALLQSLEKNRAEFGNTSPLRYLLKHEALPEDALLVHMNTLDREDLALLRGKKFAIVHCPASHAFFGHPPFPMQALRQAGVTVCLGTDSLASGERLDLFSEMRRAQSNWPEIAAAEILAMATLDGATALGMQGRIGCLAAGAFADMIALPYAGKFSEAEQAVVHFSERAPWMLVAGEIVSSQIV